MLKLDNLLPIMQELINIESFSSLLHQCPNFFFTLRLVLLVSLIIILYKYFSTTSINSPPSPPKLPIIGNLHQLGLRPYRSLHALSRCHGPLMLLHFGSVPVLIVSCAETAREVLKTHDLIFCNRPKITVFGKLLYNYKDVSAAPYGEYWRQVKSLTVLHLLNNERVRSFRSVREEEIQLMINDINKQSLSSSSKEVNLSKMFMTLTNDVISRVALGRKYSDGEDGRMFKELVGEFMELLGSIYIGDYIPSLAWLSRVNGMDARLDKVAKKFDDFLEKVVQDHVVDHSSNDVFAAGTDTYSVIVWAMSELLRHPMMMKKLQNEVRGIVGNRKEIITEDDLVEMHYLKAVIKETLRLYPILPILIPRILTQDVKINGYDIKANTQVIVNLWGIARDPNYYGKPDEFEPERFVNSGINYKGNDFHYLPYGSGRRSCPAIQFTTVIIELALANVVQKFDWKLPTSAGGLDMTESKGLTMRKKSPLTAIAVPHRSSAC
ncbi:cytochrome P450 71A26-like [Pyrus ussuriensis x Pyrus communis]|uniref:Cytochrome P450 71A26-like n=1 Tax=Pyrus ussuriensis x Pyrus communis TaxID=2448454 RepID=A0A5N5G1D1_9ROSA|nr:cytochrome P450 71A26-like [Pyrus ussuriensis x Pyrus communis]